MTTLRGVILDVDGTLIDSNDAHARSWVEVLTAAGHDVTYDHVRALIGKGGDKLLWETVKVDRHAPEGEALSERRRELFRATYLPTLRAFPGARALLERFRGDGLALVVASSAEREELGALLKQAGLDDLIEVETSSSDAERSKPDPDIIEAALERAELVPDAVLMLGDTPYDVTAAARAGVRTVALRCGGWDDDGLRGALAVYDGPDDLLARYDASPFAKRR